VSAAAYTCTASLEEIVYLAERGSIPAGVEVVARLGFEECRSRWGASSIRREWEGSWFEPPRQDGCQWIDTNYYPWWSALVPPSDAWDISNAD
jgi:hypothetical protein